MYIQAQDLTEVVSEVVLVQLSNDNTRATEVDYAVLNKACEYATETVDGYLRSRYLLPLNDVPTLVRNICLQLARYWLYSRRPEGKGFPDNVKETYSQALKEIGANGDDTLPSALKFKTKAPAKLDLSGY